MPTGLSSVTWMVIAACATDAALLGGIHLVARAGDGEPATVGRAPAPSTPGAVAPGDPDARFARPPTPWARCLEGKEHAPPSIAALTYLDRGRDAAVTLGEVRGWIGKLPPSAVQIWRLEPRDPRLGRRISLEVPEASWPAWLVPAPALALEARCQALYDALRAHGVGRPRPADQASAVDGLTRSRHDLELLFPRRPEQYTTMVLMGTVADLTEARFAELMRWLDAPVPATPAGATP